MYVCLKTRSEALPTRSVEGACCPTKVLSLEGGGPERTFMNVCLKTCSETMPTRIVEGA